MTQGFDMQRVTAAFQAGRQVKEQQERLQQEREDRETQKRFHELSFKKLKNELDLDDIRREQMARSGAVDTFNFMEQQPARQITGASGSIDAPLPDAAAKILGRSEQNIGLLPMKSIGHDPVSVPAVSGLNLPGMQLTLERENR